MDIYDTFDIYESLLWRVCPDCMNPGPPLMLVIDLSWNKHSRQQ